jgi:hypothetical protein
MTVVGLSRQTAPTQTDPDQIGSYSGSRIAVNRRLTLKWLFPQEKATFGETQKDYMYSGTASSDGQSAEQNAGDVVLAAALFGNVNQVGAG